jgi:hypothetical protein
MVVLVTKQGASQGRRVVASIWRSTSKQSEVLPALRSDEPALSAYIAEAEGILLTRDGQVGQTAMAEAAPAAGENQVARVVPKPA